jgi:hypothetical protein
MVECIAVSVLKCSIGDVFDPHIGNVVLLLGFEGADASTGAPGMTDESPAAHGTGTAHGNAQINTAQFKYGAASLKCDGTGHGLHFPPASPPDWQIAPASGDQFTVEAFIIPNTTTKSLWAKAALLVSARFCSGATRPATGSWRFGARHLPAVSIGLKPTPAASHGW